MRAIRSLRLLLEALYQDNPVRHKSAVLGRATVSPDKLERAVFTGLCEARENGITEKEFQRQKGKSIGGFSTLAALWSSSPVLRVHPFPWQSLFSYLDILHSLTLSDVERCNSRRSGLPSL